MIRVKIVPNDIKTVAKIVLIDDSDRVLFLKRSDYVEKHAGEWDLPGGHLKSNENLAAGLRREVEEETGLKVENEELVEIQANLHFFYARYNNQEVKISHEHTEFLFFNKQDLNPKEKFQKVALKALEMKK